MSFQKDVKLGDDKRPVSIIPSNEVNLYNIANGELLTDEFGIPVIAEVDEYFLRDATADRSTSIVVGTEVQVNVTLKAVRADAVDCKFVGLKQEGTVVKALGPAQVLTPLGDPQSVRT